MSQPIRPISVLFARRARGQIARLSAFAARLGRPDPIKPGLQIFNDLVELATVKAHPASRAVIIAPKLTKSGRQLLATLRAIEAVGRINLHGSAPSSEGSDKSSRAVCARPGRRLSTGKNRGGK